MSAVGSAPRPAPPRTCGTGDVASHERAVVVSHYRSQGKAAAMVLGSCVVTQPTAAFTVTGLKIEDRS